MEYYEQGPYFDQGQYNNYKFGTVEFSISIWVVAHNFENVKSFETSPIQ